MSARLPAVVGSWLVSALLSVGCTASFPAQPTAIGEPIGLSITYPAAGTRMVGSTTFSPTQFQAYTVDSEGIYVRVTDKVTWSSSNILVARHVADTAPGIWYLNASGTAEIYATYSKLVASLPIVVRGDPPYPRLEVSASGLLLRADMASSPTTARQNVTALTTWRTSDPSVATINGSGQVVGMSFGNVQITASYNGLEDSYWMAVPPRGDR